MRPLTKTLAVTMSVTIPMLPNYVQTSAGKVGVEMLTDDALRQLGAEWTNCLIAHAQKRRTQKVTP